MASTFPLEIVTPDKKFFEDEVEMVVVMGVEGELGILKNHLPLVTPLRIGKVKIKQNGEFRVASVAEGYIDVGSDRTVIVTDAAEWPDEIDVKRAELAKQRAEELLKQNKEDVDYARAEASMRRAVNRIDVAKSK